MGQIRRNSFTIGSISKGTPAVQKKSSFAYANRKAGIVFFLLILSLAALWILPSILGVSEGREVFAGGEQRNDSRSGSKNTDNKAGTGKSGTDAGNNGEAGTPEDRLKGSVVVIDPGHGGEDYGTVHGRIFEKTISLEIGMRLGELLEKSGVKVVYTRTDDTQLELRSRPELANRLKADLLISVHVNSIENAPELNGTETLYFDGDKEYDCDLTAKQLAEIIQEELSEAIGTQNRGVVERPGLAVLRLSEMPAVIVEVGYITNDSDRAKLTSPASQQKAAQAIHDAVLKALEKIKL